MDANTVHHFTRTKRFITFSRQVERTAGWTVFALQSEVVMIVRVFDVHCGSDRIEAVDRVLTRGGFILEHFHLGAWHTKTLPEKDGVVAHELHESAEQDWLELLLPNGFLLFQ